MTILNAGLNRARDLLQVDIHSGQAGTSSTTVAFTDTALGGAVAAAEDHSLDITATDKTLTVTYLMNSVTGNGNTFTEWGITCNSGSTLFNRSLTTGVEKTSEIEISRITTIYFDRE